MDTMFLAFVLAFVICGVGILLGDHKFPFASLSIIGFGVIAGAGGIWLVSGVETWSASSVFGSIVPFVLSILCLVAGYLRLTKKTVGVGSNDDATLQSKEQKILQLVFEKEPLRDDEKVLACWDGSPTNRLTNGRLLTNRALINWDKKKVERFDFAEMSNVTMDKGILESQILSFTYKGNKMSLVLTSEKGFSDAIKKAISEVTEINKKYVEYLPSVKTINVPMVDNKLSVYFPNKCIYCGGFAETTKSIEVSVSDQSSSQRGKTVTTTTLTRSINISAPYCQNHAKLSEQNEVTLYRLFGFGMLIGSPPTLFILFSTMTFSELLFRIKSSSPVTFLIGLTAILLPIVSAGLLTAWSPKFLPFLYKNKTLKHQPWIFSHGGALGIKIDFAQERNGLNFKFTNPELAQEFAHLNNAKTKNWLGKEIKKE